MGYGVWLTHACPRRYYSWWSSACKHHLPRRHTYAAFYVLHAQRDAVMGSLADLQAAFHAFQARKGAELQEMHTAKEAVEQEAATLRSQLQAAQDQLEQHRSRSGMVVPVQPAVPAPQGPRRHMADMEADLVVQRSLASMGSHGGRLPCVAASGEALPLQPLPSAGRENLGGLVATSLSPVKLEEPGTEQGGWPPGYLFKYSVRVGWGWGWAARWGGRMHG